MQSTIALVQSIPLSWTHRVHTVSVHMLILNAGHLYKRLILYQIVEDKRPLTEPPIPGYKGYIPRIKPTELGLGSRYHLATKQGFEDFVRETARQSERLTGTIPRALEG